MSDAAAVADATIPGVPRDADGPVFREPWEAQAFALAVALHERGAVQLARVGGGARPRRSGAAQAAGDPDTGETYYRHWLATLERLVAEKAVADAATLTRYADAWGRAADRTPHGTPIELVPADFA